MENDKEIETVETTDIEGKAVFAFVVSDMEIIEPTLSECGRFKVEPDYYGLTDEHVQRLKKLNKAISG